MEVDGHVSLKLATKGSLRSKKSWKFRCLGCFSKTKTEECNQNVWYAFDQFYITWPCSGSVTYLLEVGARVSLKVTIKGFPRGKKVLKN